MLGRILRSASGAGKQGKAAHGKCLPPLLFILGPRHSSLVAATSTNHPST
jgi:hypothetical protein